MRNDCRNKGIRELISTLPLIVSPISTLGYIYLQPFFALSRIFTEQKLRDTRKCPVNGNINYYNSLHCWTRANHPFNRHLSDFASPCVCVVCANKFGSFYIAISILINYDCSMLNDLPSTNQPSTLTLQSFLFSNFFWELPKGRRKKQSAKQVFISFSLISHS